MCILNRREFSDNEPNEIKMLRENVVMICGSLMLVSHETLESRAIEMTGYVTRMMETLIYCELSDNKRCL